MEVCLTGLAGKVGGFSVLGGGRTSSARCSVRKPYSVIVERDEVARSVRVWDEVCGCA